MENPISIPFLNPLFPKSALTDKNSLLFVGHNNSIDRVVRGLCSSSESHYIVTGYPGSGKTSFVSRVIVDWRKQLLTSQGISQTPVIKLDLSKSQTADKIIIKLIGKLYFNSINDSIIPNEQLIELLHLSHIRSQAQVVTQNKSDKIVKKNEHGLKISPQISRFKFSKSDLEEEKQSFEIIHRLYDIDSAINDLEKAIYLLTKPETNRPNFFQKILGKKEIINDIRLLIIIDYIDDLPSLQDLSDLFSIPNVSFIVIGSVKLYEELIEEKSKRDILDDFEIEYIPCQWNQAEKFLSNIISEKSMNSELYNNYKHYLNFFSQGLPRRIISGIDKHTKRDNNNIFCLQLTDSDIEEVKLYSKLHQILWNNRKKILGTGFDRKVFSRDKLLRGIYYLTAQLFQSKNFTFNDAEKKFSEISYSINIHDHKNILKKLLNVLVEEKLLIQNNYRFQLSEETLCNVENIDDWFKEEADNKNSSDTNFEVDFQLVSQTIRPISPQIPEFNAEKPVEILRTIIQKYNTSIIYNSSLFNALLKDYCKGDHKGEVNVLNYSIGKNIPQDILLNKNNIPLSILSDQLIQRLIEDEFIKNDLAVWAVNAWIDVLEMKNEW
jgi:hypothetical protein